MRPASGGSGGRSSARRSWSASATWTPATGAPTCRRAPVQVRPALGRGRGQPDGDLPAGPLRPAGRRDRARIWPNAAATGIPSGPAGRTGCCAKWPLAPATWPKCWAAPSRSTCCSTSRCSGPSSSPAWTCCCCWPCSASACARSRRSCWCWSRPSALLLHRDFRPSADAAQLPGDGPRARDAAASASRNGRTSPSASSARP